jgi:vesicle transport protein SEC22
MSISSGDKVFYYMTRESLCFLTLAEARYPRRLAFLYLDEIGDLILGELVREFGNNVSLDFSFYRICQSWDACG